MINKKEKSKKSYHVDSGIVDNKDGTFNYDIIIAFPKAVIDSLRTALENVSESSTVKKYGISSKDLDLFKQVTYFVSVDCFKSKASAQYHGGMAAISISEFLRNPTIESGKDLYTVLNKPFAERTKCPDYLLKKYSNMFDEALLSDELDASVGAEEEYENPVSYGGSKKFSDNN